MSSYWDERITESDIAGYDKWLESQGGGNAWQQKKLAEVLRRRAALEAEAPAPVEVAPAPVEAAPAPVEEAPAPLAPPKKKAPSRGNNKKAQIARMKEEMMAREQMAAAQAEADINAAGRMARERDATGTFRGQRDLGGGFGLGGYYDVDTGGIGASISRSFGGAPPRPRSNPDTDRAMQALRAAEATRGYAEGTWGSSWLGGNEDALAGAGGAAIGGAEKAALDVAKTAITEGNVAGNEAGAAVGGAAGTALGTAFGGPLGGAVGGALGSAAGDALGGAVLGERAEPVQWLADGHKSVGEFVKSTHKDRKKKYDDILGLADGAYQKRKGPLRDTSVRVRDRGFTPKRKSIWEKVFGD